MSSLLLPIPRLGARTFPADWPRRVLVAADGRDSSNAAIAVAWELAERTSVDLISVLQTNARDTLTSSARDTRAEQADPRFIIPRFVCRTTGG